MRLAGSLGTQPTCLMRMLGVWRSTFTVGMVPWYFHTRTPISAYKVHARTLTHTRSYAFPGWNAQESRHDADVSISGISAMRPVKDP